ncbi:F-box only protein 39-like [Mizuhopecten yessoensis]|uniref:F-box only protein 39 n=1 Tax=Mizuhopecten yessoensis TaxID=6573 RepID=A0A210Q851_MIZYE|nr:F-box only protein 39-like [Mizuhopecten yessoensis]OWF44918.1 F-box only protein 39 [Mizuhopecten yessoensis]
MDIGWVVRKAEQIFNRFWGRNMEKSVWENLPDVAMIEVFKLLRDPDKANLALTCTNWARLFYTPSLWRNRHFDMGGYKCHTNGVRANKFADQLGAYVEYLSITCSHPSYHITKAFQESMEDLLVKFRGSQLKEFEMERLELDRFWKHDSARDKFMNSFVKFFKTQKRLKVFDMTAAQCVLTGGLKIIEAVGQKSGKTLEEIYIEDFFPARFTVYSVERFQMALSFFTNLSYIAVNYHCISEEIIEMFSKTLAGKLKFFNIKVYRNNPHLHRISPFAWKQLTTVCPKLQVMFWFDSVAKSTEIIPILVPEIPVQDVHIWTGYEDDVDWNLSHTITHIANSYAATLGAASLEIDNNQEFVDEAMLYLVNKCKRLFDLSLNASVLLSTIETVLEQIDQRKSNLRSLHITACGLSEMEWAELGAIKDRFTHMAADRNIDLNISTDLVLDPF